MCHFKVYELQCIREKELETMDLTEQMSSLSFSVSVPPPNLPQMMPLMPQMPQIAQMPHNDIKTDSSDDGGMDEEMEEGGSDEKFCQAKARSDPVYLVQQQQLHQHQQQLHQQQQQMILQQIQQQQQTNNRNCTVVDTLQYPSLVSHQQHLCSMGSIQQ